MKKLTCVPYKILLSTFLCLSFSSCNIISKSQAYKQTQREWKSLDILNGKWATHTEGGQQYEVWKTENDTLKSGISYIKSAGDSIVFETIELKLSGNDIYFIPTVIDQNDTKPIDFKLMTVKDNYFIFENKKHDFPQRVAYAQTHRDTLKAWVDGMQDGHYKRIDFIMGRSE